MGFKNDPTTKADDIVYVLQAVTPVLGAISTLVFAYFVVVNDNVPDDIKNVIAAVPAAAIGGLFGVSQQNKRDKYSTTTVDSMVSDKTDIGY